MLVWLSHQTPCSLRVWAVRDISPLRCYQSCGMGTNLQAINGTTIIYTEFQKINNCFIILFINRKNSNEDYWFYINNIFSPPLSVKQWDVLLIKHKNKSLIFALFFTFRDALFNHVIFFLFLFKICPLFFSRHFFLCMYQNLLWCTCIKLS